MSNGSVAECVAPCDAPAVEMEMTSSGMLPRWRAIPWQRVAIDALLVLAIVLASSSLLTVR